MDIIKILKLGERRRKNGTSVVFVDFAKAFDQVDRETLIKILKKRLGESFELHMYKQILS